MAQLHKWSIRCRSEHKCEVWSPLACSWSWPNVSITVYWLHPLSCLLQSPAGPQHPRGQGARLMWSFLCSGVSVCWTRVGPEHLLPGWGSGRGWTPWHTDQQGNGPSHRAEFPGHGVALWQRLHPQTPPVRYQTRELRHQEWPNGESWSSMKAEQGTEPRRVMTGLWLFPEETKATDTSSQGEGHWAAEYNNTAPTKSSSVHV